MADLNALLEKAATEYDARKAAADAQAVRWEHYSAPAYDPKPLYFERTVGEGTVKRGRPVKSPTARTCSYGLDSRGRVVVDRQPAQGEDEPAFEEFFIHHKNGIESAAYGRQRSHPLQYVTRQVLRGGRPASTDVLDASTPTSFSEYYRYDARGRLVEIRVTSVDGKRKDKVRYDVVYETDGRLRVVRRYYDYLPIPCPVYWNPATIPSLQAMEDAMRKKLVEAIPKAIRKAKVKGPAYCVAIVYDTENEELPPLIGVGVDSERRKWLTQDPRAPSR